MLLFPFELKFHAQRDKKSLIKHSTRNHSLLEVNRKRRVDVDQRIVKERSRYIKG